jgi:hypothetical protein
VLAVCRSLLPVESKLLDGVCRPLFLDMPLLGRWLIVTRSPVVVKQDWDNQQALLYSASLQSNENVLIVRYIVLCKNV